MTVDPGNFVSTVSCPTATFCVGVDNAGNAVHYSGGAWSAPVPVGSNLYDVSCSSTTFCAATEFVNPLVTTPAAVYFFNGSSWTLATSLMDTGGYLQIRCTSSDFCMAMDGAGDAYTYSHGVWSGAVSAIHGVWPRGLACASVHFCAALGGFGEAVTWNGAAWSAAVTWGTPQNTVVGISCPSAESCFAANDVMSANNPLESRTYVLRFVRGRWANRALPGNYSALGISCPSRTFCLMTQSQSFSGLDYYRTWSPGPRSG